MSPPLLNKGAVITGGSRGIGFAIAQELINQGAKVVICSRNKFELQKALKRLNSNGEFASGTVCDVSKFRDCKKIISFAQKKLNKIDILVNNAGAYGPIGPLEKLDLNEWHKALVINLLGTVYCTSLLIPSMKKRKYGKIINLCGAGVGASNTMPNFSAYFTSKFAIAGFTEVIADELADYNIQINSISPGAVNTYLNEYLIKQGPKKAGGQIYEQALKQKKGGGISPQLAATLVVFLASDKSNHISGRLLSAKWNPPESLKKTNFKHDLYKLRRIDQELFYEK